MLATGPTGSGKSTTLYGALNEINEPERNIITIEDPVEYQLAGVNQLQVNLKAGLTFAGGLRAMLRADPDVIMVGEIRDGETAKIAIESALTGHLVLSTLHTNDAPSAITRLTEMGIEPFLTASAVCAVVAQRLVRQLCTHCKRHTTLSVSSLERAGFSVAFDLDAYEPVGCACCGNSGYKGRTGLYEVMSITDEIRDLRSSALLPKRFARSPSRRGCVRCVRTGSRRSRTASRPSPRLRGSRDRPLRPIRSDDGVRLRRCPAAGDGAERLRPPPDRRLPTDDPPAREAARAGLPGLTPQMTREVVYSILTNDQRQRLETDWQIDFAYSIPGKARYRVNAYFQRASLSAAFRLIPSEMPKLRDLGLPPVLQEFTKKPRGFVLVTGPTGSGKSTTRSPRCST